MNREIGIEEFYVLLLEAGAPQCADFLSFCNILGCDFNRFDNAVYESFGICGDELLLKMR